MLPYKISNRGSGRVYPAADEVLEESGHMELSMYGVLSSEEANACQTDSRGKSPHTCNLENRENSNHRQSDEREEDEDSFQEIDLSASIASRTLVDLKVSLCKTSTTSRNCIPSAIATGNAAAEGGTGNRSPVGAGASLGTTQSLQQIHHVTEVVTVDVVESVECIAVDESETTSVNTEEQECERKCTQRFCLIHGKGHVETALLIFCYLVVGLLLFPFVLIILMVCCISYFTPDIDD